MIKVAVDTGPLNSESKSRGIGSYAQNLIEALDAFQKKDKTIKIDFFDFSKSKKSALEKYNLLHYLHFNIVGKDNIRITKTPFVVTIHDVIPLIYPKSYPLGIKGKTRLYLKISKFKKAAAVITNSNTSKKDIIRFLKTDLKNVYTIYMAANHNYKKINKKEVLFKTKNKYNLKDKFVLYVGDINYNKNLYSLCKACDLAKINLVIVGKQAGNISDLVSSDHKELVHLKKIQKVIKNSKYIKVLGYIEQSELIEIYNLATLYFQPSLYEGFGIPVLEAMRCKTPVAISKNQALSEIFGKCSLVADDTDYQSLKVVLDKFFDDKQKLLNLSKRAFEYSFEFSWEKNAIETIKIYKKYAK